MLDAGFHIVKKNGQIEIVKLEPLQKKSSSDSKIDCPAKKNKCDPERKPFVYPKYISTKLTNIEQPSTRKVPLKTYSRIRKKDIQPVPICLKKNEECPAIQTAIVDVPDVKPVLIHPNECEDVQAATVDVPDVEPVLIHPKEYEESPDVQAATVDVPDVEPVLIHPKEYKERPDVQAATVDVPDVEPVLIHPKECEERADVQAATVDVSITIKTEPELDIVDEEPEPIEPEQEETDNLDERLVPTGEHMIRQNLSTIPNLLKLAKKPIKCNVCGMIFPESESQVRKLGRHFLKHKTSVVVKKDDSYYRNIYGKQVAQPIHNFSDQWQQTDMYLLKTNGMVKSVAKKYDETFCENERDIFMKKARGRPKVPVVLNHFLPKVLKPIAIIPVVKTYRSPAEKKKIESTRIEVSDLPRMSKLRRLAEADIESVPHDALHHLRSSQSGQKTEKPHVLIGSTLIKPITQSKSIRPVDEESITASTPVNTTELKGPDDAVISDADDDVEIVEEKPDVIVIDDNDEDRPNDIQFSLTENVR